MPVRFDEIVLGLEFVDGGQGQHEAIVSRETGKIYHHAEFSDLEEFNDELPDDVEDDEKYVAIPDKKALGLGKPLALDFAREFLPKEYDEVHEIFSRRGAYKTFRALLIRTKTLDRWYSFETQATERALRAWCADNAIELAD